jgi:hypothetical protein
MKTVRAVTPSFRYTKLLIINDLSYYTTINIFTKNLLSVS